MAVFYKLLKTRFLMFFFNECDEMKHNMLMNPKFVEI